MFYRTGWLCLLIMVAGCQVLEANADLFILEVSGKEFNAGDNLQLTLINLSNKTHIVHPSLCNAQLQVWQDAQWEPIYKEGSCTRIGLELLPSQRIQVMQKIDSIQVSGVYRYEYSIYGNSNNRIYVRSERFEIVN